VLLKQKQESPKTPGLFKGKFFREASGIILFGIALFVFLSLYSHNSSDPAWNRFVSSKTVTVINTGGIIGAYLSDILVQGLGAGGYFLPLAIACIGWRVFSEKSYRHPVLLITGGTAGTICLCSLLNIVYAFDPLFGQVKSGGAIGWFIGDHLLRFFNYGGALIIISTCLIISTLFITGLSLQDILSGATSFFLYLYRTITKIPVPKFTLPKIRFPDVPSLISSLISSWREKKTVTRKKIEQEEQKKAVKPHPPTVVTREKKKDMAIKIKTNEGHEKKESFVAMKNSLPSDDAGDYHLPSIELLDEPSDKNYQPDSEELIENSKVLLQKLKDFNIEGKIEQVLPGPIITMYEFEPGSGVKVSRILNLTDDLALAMKSISIRIHAPIPGKSVVGIELPNKKRAPVALKDIMMADRYRTETHKLTLALGKDTSGNPVVTNLATIPHLLVAGATGPGKSVGINALI